LKKTAARAGQPPPDPGQGAPPSFFEQIFRASLDALVVVDPAGGIRLVNPQAERLFDYQASELAGRPIEELIPMRFREAHRRHRALYAVRPHSRPMGMSLALSARRRDGSEFPVETSLSPFQFEGTTLVCVNIRDVSELHRAQGLLARARQSNAVADFGRLTLTNKDIGAIQQEACRLTARLLGADCALVVRCDRAEPAPVVSASCGLDDRQLPATLARLADRCGADAHAIELPLFLDDLRSAASETAPESADLAPASALLAAIPGDEQTLGLLVAGAMQRRSFSRDDASFLQALANTIGAAIQRTHAEKQLFQSQRLEALGQLTGGVAHDFNNLLTVVSGNLQMLEERVAGDALSVKLVKAALRATGRGADLTRKLLAFSRRQTLQPRAIDVHQLLSSLADILRRTLGAHIDVSAVVDEGLPSVRADPAMLDIALLNLAVNSRDAMPDGGRLVLSAALAEIGADAAAREDDLAPGRYMRIIVADTGTGMTPEVKARAFEPFFTTKESGKGSGLGLSLVYGFAKQSGGHIHAESSPGMGTSISLYLPIDAGAASQPLAGSPDSAYRGGTETVLVVEDDDGVREVAVGFLRRLGYRVLEAADAPRALELLEREPATDLLFSDVMLRGEINGPALAREALQRRPGLRVLFASGYARNAIPSREQFDGVQLLSKPYRIDQLARALRRAIGREPAEPMPDEH
jgi:PAS domain S-box-containing protein